jgi:tetratricopeptide (TPR) repeat protein
MLPPPALLTGLSSRLKLLTGGPRNLSARQQTLRGAIDWSYNLLDQAEQQFFHRMAVFNGGRTLQALEDVCNFDGKLQLGVLDGVQSLLDKSLLQQREGRDGEPRFWVLETIQEYAKEKLEQSGERQALQKEHALYYMALAEEAEPEFGGEKQAEWYSKLEEEHDNLRSALRWARERGEIGENDGDPGEGDGAVAGKEIGLRIAGAMRRFWLTRGYLSEGREELEELITPLLETETSATSMSRSEKAGIAPLHIRPIFRKAPTVNALIAVGMLTHAQGDYSAARFTLEEALAIATELGDMRSAGHSLNSLGNVAFDQGNYPQARTLYEQSLALHKELGDKSGMAWCLSNLGLVANLQGDYPQARFLYEQSLALHTELGDKGGVAATLINTGITAYSEGDYPAAHSLCTQSLILFAEVGVKWGIASNLAVLGAVAVALSASTHAPDSKDAREGRVKGEVIEHPGGMELAERGARLLGAAEGILAAIGAVLLGEDRIPYERGIASALSLLGAEAFEKAMQEGRAMSMEDAMDYALAITVRGSV